MAAEDPTTKRCPRCDKFLPRTAFGSDKKRRDGLKGWCRKCHTAATLERYHRDPTVRQRHLAQSDSWRRNNLERHRKSVRESQTRHREKRNAGQNAQRKANPEARRKQTRRYYEKNREAILARNQTWRSLNALKTKASSARYKAENPERIAALKRGYKARKKGAEGTHTAEDVMRILRMQKRRCAYCKCRLGREYHVDHIVPLSKGGDNSPKNLQITCVPCNLKKKDKDPLLFARKLGLLL